MRYFVELSYNGTAYCGWQRQPNAPSVQQTIEEVLQTILRQKVTVVGCGRTDTGVHAKQYFLHFDYSPPLPDYLLHRLNKMLPKDIVFYRIFEVDAQQHARFSATHRAYEYHIVAQKAPFEIDTAFYYPFFGQLDFHKLQAAAQLLLEYDDFFSFCKTNTDVKTMRCAIRQSEWEIREQRLIFHIAADRFLRGMVRLIVGMCLNVSLGKLELHTVHQALIHQKRLPKSYSVPPQGLFLTDIRY